MKALTIWQPWAQLIANGAKSYETRSWPAPRTLIGQRIAIHAAKRWDRELHATCLEDPFRSALLGFSSPSDLPRGAVLATARLLECSPTEAISPSRAERLFGDWTPGRFAWLLVDVEVLKKPVPARGAQGLWDYQPSGARPGQTFLPGLGV